jgi:hypothetical protein
VVQLIRDVCSHTFVGSLPRDTTPAELMIVILVEGGCEESHSGHDASMALELGHDNDAPVSRTHCRFPTKVRPNVFVGNACGEAGPKIDPCRTQELPRVVGR